MSADELRRAATTLRDLCAQADADYDPENEERWFSLAEPRIGVWGKFSAAYSNEAPYIATMHPGVGFALADWLDDMAEAFDWCAERWEDPDEAASIKVWGYESAMEAARLINGGAS